MLVVKAMHAIIHICTTYLCDFLTTDEVPCSALPSSSMLPPHLSVVSLEEHFTPSLEVSPRIPEF